MPQELDVALDAGNDQSGVIFDETQLLQCTQTVGISVRGVIPLVRLTLHRREASVAGVVSEDAI